MPASHVDHITPLTGATDATRLDQTAVQSLCRSCHSAKTAREDRGFGNSAQRHGVDATMGRGSQISDA